MLCACKALIPSSLLQHAMITLNSFYTLLIRMCLGSLLQKFTRYPLPKIAVVMCKIE